MKILITSGGTSEKIDGVRTITNMSTGRLGAGIANTLVENTFTNLEIFFLSSNKCTLPKQHRRIKVVEITDTQSVLDNMKNIIENNKIDYVIHAMAISDYTTDKVFSLDALKEAILKEDLNNVCNDEMINNIINNIIAIDNSKKISSNNDSMFVQLKKTPKIVDMIKQWDNNIKLISFKLLNGVSEEELINVAKKQLDRTNSDLVIANDLVNIKNGNHRALFVEKDKFVVVEGKSNIANSVFDYIYSSGNLITEKEINNIHKFLSNRFRLDWPFKKSIRKNIDNVDEVKSLFLKSGYIVEYETDLIYMFKKDWF